LDYTPLVIADRCKELRSKFVALSSPQFITKENERKPEYSHVQVVWNMDEAAILYACQNKAASVEVGSQMLALKT
jgi:transcription initiation factor IIE alpha subunit